MSRQQNDINGIHADTDIVIAVGDHSVPATPTSPTTTTLTPATNTATHVASTGRGNAGTSSEQTNTTILPHPQQQQQQQQQQEHNNSELLQDQETPSGPLPFVHQPPLTFATSDDPALYAFPSSNSHSTTGVSNGYSPTLQSEVLPGHQRPSMPYNSTSRSDYSAFPASYRASAAPFTQPHLHIGQHRLHHGHDHDSMGPINVMNIDYDGLDASVNEAGLIESGYHEPQPVPLDHKDQTQSSVMEKSSGGLDRAVSSGSSSRDSGSAFQRRSARKSSYYSERSPRPPLPEQIRYTFYSRTAGFIEAPSLPQILSKASLEGGGAGTEGPRVFSDLLKDGCFWIDILDPSDFDMQILSKHFHIHPLTIEDISTEEVREKYEVFRNYYFVCFRTFDQDYNSGSYLQPASMYSVVLREGIITFHFLPTTHHLNVLRRLEQFHSHITLTPDWINYALLDDITDSFASPIQTIEYEVDSIDDLVLLLRENETTDMLRRIGSCRKNVMAISRLLMNKADVIRGLMKRFDERYMMSAGGAWGYAGPREPARDPVIGAVGVGAGVTAGTGPGASGRATPTGNVPGAAARVQPDNMSQHQQPQYLLQNYRETEIMLYLGDILDHVLTMLQSLNSYEKVLGRSHSNYLAQISLEINQLSNKTNNVVGTLTFFASLIVPMTFIAGLWGMNVHVPGQPDMDGEPLTWFWCLIGVMGIYSVLAVIFGKHYGLI
ncbi:CorA metal ion transporter [Mortierella hygrophila]|uniref:CorA metal ion transporter n=1 Tax=Mortierella hygrophila TaxID=979708 RepID=A0A9P6K5X5_9FUNG|nr:CorA metal ion transporter [Mortierella hygrophila]